MATSVSILNTAKQNQHILKQYGFFIRFLVITAFVGFIMRGFAVNIGAIGQGLALCLVGVGVFITFRVLNFPDLTVDGSFPIGGAIAAAMISSGSSAELTIFAAFAGGALTGLTTALIHVLFKIEGLLASIIVATGAYTITLRVMGTSNIPLLGEDTLLSPFVPQVREYLVQNYGDDARRYASNLVEIAVFSVIVLLVLLLLNWFLRTEIGLSLRASGKNSQMVRAVGINDKIMVIIGLMISNGLAGLAGCLTVQQLGFADVQMGVGVIVRGLAAVMIGEVLLRPRTVSHAIVAAAYGMLIFEISRAWVFSALDLAATDVRFISALVVFTALAAPYLLERWREYQHRMQMQRETTNEV